MLAVHSTADGPQGFANEGIELFQSVAQGALETMEKIGQVQHRSAR
jgi:hypothetical protein